MRLHRLGKSDSDRPRRDKQFGTRRGAGLREERVCQGGGRCQQRRRDQDETDQNHWATGLPRLCGNISSK